MKCSEDWQLERPGVVAAPLAGGPGPCLLDAESLLRLSRGDWRNAGAGGAGKAADERVSLHGSERSWSH